MCLIGICIYGLYDLDLYLSGGESLERSLLEPHRGAKT